MVPGQVVSSGEGFAWALATATNLRPGVGQGLHHPWASWLNWSSWIATPRTVEPDELYTLKAELTMVDGRVAYEKLQVETWS
jgi:hypothetical protein